MIAWASRLSCGSIGVAEVLEHRVGGGATRDVVPGSGAAAHSRTNASGASVAWRLWIPARPNSPEFSVAPRRFRESPRSPQTRRIRREGAGDLSRSPWRAAGAAGTPARVGTRVPSSVPRRTPPHRPKLLASISEPWRRRGGGRPRNHGIAPSNAGFDSKWQRELRHVTAETKTPGEPGVFTASWSGKRDLKPLGHGGASARRCSPNSTAPLCPSGFPRT